MSRHVQVKNGDVVGEAPTGDLSGNSFIAHQGALILQIWRYVLLEYRLIKIFDTLVITVTFIPGCWAPLTNINRMSLHEWTTAGIYSVGAIIHPSTDLNDSLSTMHLQLPHRQMSFSGQSYWSFNIHIIKIMSTFVAYGSAKHSVYQASIWLANPCMI